MESEATETIQGGTGVTKAVTQKKSIQYKLIVLVIAATAVITLGLIFKQELSNILKAGVEWTHGLGVWGPVVVVGIYIASCVLSLPGSVLTIATGAVFGLWVGTVTVSIGSTLGACAAFLVGRFFARKMVAQKVAQNAKFSAIDEAVGREGFKIVFLTRLSPIFPFNLLNYGYGLTKVPLWKYALASWGGMLPGTVMYVYVGAALGEAAIGDRSKTTGEWVLYGFGLAVTIVVTILVTRVARKALKESVTQDSAKPVGE